MLKMDSHIHSEYSPDSHSRIDDILKTAQERDLDKTQIYWQYHQLKFLQH